MLGRRRRVAAFNGRALGDQLGVLGVHLEQFALLRGTFWVCTACVARQRRKAFRCWHECAAFSAAVHMGRRRPGWPFDHRVLDRQAYLSKHDLGCLVETVRRCP
jgi:hypothetical protein